ncbi:MAG: hypothetical protein HS117_00515 [Verrucomicrobiaceae bacterium]|nr:hypothetical protein [Verrucomicrobiaceae bacterium]
MRLTSRPSFYVIFLLLAAMLVLTAWLLWKLPEAEELSREKKNASPGPFPISRS